MVNRISFPRRPLGAGLRPVLEVCAVWLALAPAVWAQPAAPQPALPPPEVAAPGASGAGAAGAGSGRLAGPGPSFAPLSGDATTATWVVIIPNKETISDVARRSRTTVKRILAANPGLTPALAEPGDAIRVSGPASLKPTSQSLEVELMRGVRGRKEVALTIDTEGVTSQAFERLLATLDRHKVKASFFVLGQFLKAHSQGIEQISAKGYPIYNHSDTHPRFTKLTDEQIRNELMAVENVVQQRIGKTTRPYWRPPYGDRDKRVRRVAAAAGFRSVFWTVDALDWEKGPPSAPQAVFARVCEKPFKESGGDPDPLDGAIILMHAHAKSVCENLDLVVPYLKSKGYTFVALDDLLKP
jgi:peptidoglycan/xylan/chitin deacetylase (PgdA/CDA1 family)